MLHYYWKDYMLYSYLYICNSTVTHINSFAIVKENLFNKNRGLMNYFTALITFMIRFLHSEYSMGVIARQ